MITEVRMPVPPHASRGNYVKAMERKAWAFALASVAVRLDFDGDRVKEASIVLGGVANTPRRAVEAEAALKGKRLDSPGIARAAELAVSGAQPLAKNAYKIALTKGIITEALTSL
jgi:xanthine dehydrogenase YagS FAD-binding subunit